MKIDVLKTVAFVAICGMLYFAGVGANLIVVGG